MAAKQNRNKHHASSGEANDGAKYKQLEYFIMEPETMKYLMEERTLIRQHAWPQNVNK